MTRAYSYYIERRRFSPIRREDVHGHDLSPRLLALMLSEPLTDATVLDLGCGSGRVTLALAPYVKRAVGADWSEAAIEEARERAARTNLANCSFVVADVDASNYGDLLASTVGEPDCTMVVANLCMSDAMIRRSADLLAPGGSLCFAAFHRAQWSETGRSSRFAYDEEQLADALEEAGFAIEAMAVEQEIVTFAAAEEIFEQYLAGSTLLPRWREDGRLGGLHAYFTEGGRGFTAKSHLVVKARRVG